MSTDPSEDHPAPEADRIDRIVVDAMNVIGTTPDGWWRDRDGAALRLLDRLSAFASREDVAVTVVLDGRPSARRGTRGRPRRGRGALRTPPRTGRCR